VLTFYEVIRELWELAKELGLHDRGLGASTWHPDDVGVLRRDDPETQDRIDTSLQFMARSDWERRSGSSESSRSFATRSASVSRGRGSDRSGTSVSGTLWWSIQPLRRSNSWPTASSSPIVSDARDLPGTPATRRRDTA
jgi:hypothetical protein